MSVVPEEPYTQKHAAQRCLRLTANLGLAQQNVYSFLSPRFRSNRGIDSATLSCPHLTLLNMKTCLLLSVVALLSSVAPLATQGMVAAAGGTPSTTANVHAMASNNYPLPRASLPADFGAKVAFQTVTRVDPKNENNRVVSEKLVRCGIETDAEGNELFPCNPSFDTRPYIKGLDHGTCLLIVGPPLFWSLFV